MKRREKRTKRKRPPLKRVLIVNFNYVAVSSIYAVELKTQCYLRSCQLEEMNVNPGCINAFLFFNSEKVWATTQNTMNMKRISDFVIRIIDNNNES